jgi:WD40 repeat protein
MSELNSRQDLITAMSIHPTRSWIATASVDGSISIVDPKLGVIGSLDPVELDFTQIAWHPHRQILATGSQQGEVTIWACEGIEDSIVDDRSTNPVSPIIKPEFIN